MFIRNALLLFLSFLMLNKLTHAEEDLDQAPSNGSPDDVEIQTSELPSPRMVIVGPTGSGKSSLANALLGFDPEHEDNALFTVCPPSMNSCTKEISYGTGKWLGKGPMFTVVDTPGFADSDKQDGVLMKDMTDFLKNNLKEAEVLVLLLDGTETRFHLGLQSMLQQYSTLFGNQWWDHLLVAVSFWEFDQYSIDKRGTRCPGTRCKNETWFINEIQDQLETKFHLNKTFEFAFLHSYSQSSDNLDDPIRQKYWKIESDKLWNFATSIDEPMAFKDVDDILQENQRFKREISRLNGIINKNITKITQDMAIINENIDQNKAELSRDMETINENIDQNKADMETINGTIVKLERKTVLNSGAIDASNANIVSNSGNINSNTNKINLNTGAIDANNAKIVSNSGNINSNTNKISLNSGNINSNNNKINLNTGAIDALEIGVGVCGYQNEKTGSGTITYDKLSGTSTDGSTISTTTGKYTVKTQGLYSITFSAWTLGQTTIYLYKDGAKQYDIGYFSRQDSGDKDQGSRTVVMCLTERQEIHLEATSNTVAIYRMQFCVTLLSEASC